MAKIVFAFALNNEGIFGDNYFGDADKFAIYKVIKGDLEFTEVVPNELKKINFEKNIDTEIRKNTLVSFLKSKSVSVLVSRQFSPYLRKVNDEFIPVIIEKEDPLQAVKILNKNMRWIKDELKNKNSDYNLFRIKTGVLKLAVK